MELSEKTRVSLSLWSIIAGATSLVSTTVVVLMFFGVIAMPGATGQSIADCDSVKICADEKYITKEKLNDSLRIFEKDIEFLKKGEVEQQKVNEKTERQLEKITDLLIQIKRDIP